MRKVSKRNLLLVILMVVGLSFVLIGCGDGDGNTNDLVGPVMPTPTPVPTPITLLNTTVSLSANNGFCAFLTFRLTEVWDTTVRVTGPANTDPDFRVYSPVGQTVSEGVSIESGSEVVIFEPPLAGTYDLEVCDYKELGGTFSVSVTQMVQ